MEEALEPSVTADPSVRAPRLWGALGSVALYALIQFATAVLVMMILMVVQRMLHPGIDLKHLAHDKQTAFLVIGISLPISCIASLAAFRGLYAGAWRRADATGIAMVPIRPARFLQQVLLGLGVAVAGGLLTLLLTQGHPVHQDIMQIMRKASPLTRLLIAVTAVTVVPLAEETLFRGILLPALMRHLPVAAAVAIDAGLFALMHLPDLGWKPAGLASLALVGLVCCWRRLKTGSILSSVAVHAGNNLLAMVMLLALAH